MEFFSDMEKSILQLIQNLRGPQIGKTILERTAKLEASDFRTYDKGTVTKKCTFDIKCMLSHSVMLTLCDLLDCSPPDSSVQGIPQARTLEGVAICKILKILYHEEKSTQNGLKT